jgi:hypothetical protein
LVDDTWLGPVFVARGVLIPLQAERLAVQDGRPLWAAAVAVSRAFGVAADLTAAEGCTTTLLPGGRSVPPACR